MNAFEYLANAIIIQAARDYRDALNKLSRGRENADAVGAKAECERLCRSEWYQALTSVDAQLLIRKLNEEVNAQ